MTVLRKEVIPGLTRAQIKAKEEKNKDPDEKIPLKKSSWAKLLARVFSIDISKCVHCNGKMKIIASIKDPPVIKRILTHLVVYHPALLQWHQIAVESYLSACDTLKVCDPGEGCV
jgi:hypothetical protein